MTLPHPRILCISWDAALAKERERVFEEAGYRVSSVIGPEAAEVVESADADVLVLGHSIPREDKRKFMRLFRRHSEAPIVSLLREGQSPLPEATIALPGDDPRTLGNLVRIIR